MINTISLVLKAVETMAAINRHVQYEVIKLEK